MAACGPHLAIRDPRSTMPLRQTAGGSFIASHFAHERKEPKVEEAGPKNKPIFRFAFRRAALGLLGPAYLRCTMLRALLPPLSKRSRPALSTRRDWACPAIEIAGPPRGVARLAERCTWQHSLEPSSRTAHLAAHVHKPEGLPTRAKHAIRSLPIRVRRGLQHRPRPPTLVLLPKLFSGTPAVRFRNDLACRIPQQSGDLHVRIEAQDLSGHKLALGYRHTADEPFQLGYYRRTDGQCT